MQPLSERLYEVADLWDLIWPTTVALFSVVAFLVVVTAVKRG